MTTYYIDYKNGADAAPGDGSSANPYRTLTKALSVAGNSDTILARGDNTDNTTWFRELGHTVSETGLTLAADTGHTPTFVGSHEYATWTPTGGTANVYEATYTSGQCFAVWNGTTKLSSKASVALCDATTNSFFFDNAGNKLYVNIGGGAPTSIEAFDVGNTYALIVTGANVTLSGLYYQYQIQAVDIRSGGSTVAGCTFALWVRYLTTPDFCCLLLNGSTHTISDCSFIYGMAAKATASDVTVEDSTFYSGIGINFLGGTGHIVRRCAFTVCSDGVYTYNATAAWEVEVSQCIFTNCTHSAVVFGSATHAGTGIVHHCTASYYQVNANGRHGIVFHNSGFGYAYHNVFYGDVADAQKDGLYFHPLGPSDLTVVARNNTFVNCDIAITQPGGVVNEDVDYSAFYNCSTNYSNVVGGGHDITADPLFVDAPGHDFALTKPSPCIDVGAVVAGINDGTGGSAHYLGAAPDIGAFEYEGRVRTLTTTGAG